MSLAARARRWFGYAAAASLALVAVTFVAIHLPPVQRYALDRVEGLVSDSIHGALTVGDPSGGLFFGTFRVGPSRLEDQRGRALVAIEGAAIDVAWFASVLEGGLVVDSVEVEAPKVWMAVDEDGNSFSRLAKPTRTSTSSGPSFGPITLVARRAVIQDGSYTLEGTGEPVEFDDVDATFSGRLEGERILSTVEEIAADSPLWATRAHVEGRVTIEPDELYGRALVFDEAGTSVDVTSARLRYDGVAIDARFDAEVAPATIAHYVEGLAVNARLAGAFTHEAAGAWRVDAEGRANGAPLAIEARAGDDFSTLLADLHLGPGVDASSVYEGLPKSALGIDAHVDITRLTPITGTARAMIRGRVESPGSREAVEIRSLVAEASATDGAFTARAELDGGAPERDHSTARGPKRGSSGGARLSATASGRIDDGFALDRASAEFAIDALSPFVARFAPVSGGVRGTARFVGPLDRPTVTADVHGRRLAYEGVRVGRVHVDATVEGPFDRLDGRARVDARHVAFGPARVGRLRAEAEIAGALGHPVGTADLHARGVALGDDRLGRVDVRAAREAGEPYDLRLRVRRGRGRLESADARVAIALDGSDVRAEVKHLEAEAIGSTWRARSGARIAFADGALRVEDLNVAADGVRLGADVALDLERQRIVALDVEIPELHVDALRRAGFVPHDDGDGAISARITKRREVLRADLSVFGADLGRGRAAVRVCIPKRPFEPESWTRLTVDDIRRVRLDLARLDVGALQRMLGVEPVIRGAASGGIAFRRGHLERGALDLDGARILGVSEDVAFYVSIDTPDETWARVRLTGVLDGEPVLRTELAVDADVARLRREGLRAIVDIDFSSTTRLDAFPLSAIERPERMGGAVTGTVALARSGGEIDLDVRAEARRAKWNTRWPEIDLSVEGRAARGHATLTAELEAREAGHLTVTARGDTPAASADPAAWAALRLDDLTSVELHADGAHLDQWADALELPRLRGVAGADVVLGRSGRTGEAAVRLDGFAMAETDAAIDARAFVDARPDRTTLEATAFANDRPLLDADASTPLSLARLTSTSTAAIGELPVRAHVRAAEIPMKLLARLLGAKDDVEGSVALVGELSGALGDPKLEAHLHSADMRVGKSAFEHFAVDFALNDRVVAAEASLRQAAGGRLVLDGTVGLGGDETLIVDLRANDFDLAFLSLVSGAGSATFGGVAGKIDGEVEMRGDQERPLVAGVLRLVGVRAVLVHPVPPMEDIDGELVFEERGLRFDIRGASGDGTFALKGEAAGGPSGLEVDSELEIEDVAIAAGPKILDTDLTADIDVRFTDRLDVDVLVTGGAVKLPTKGATERLPVEDLEDVVLVDELSAEPPPREPQDEEAAAPLAYRIQVRTAGQLPIRSPDLNANLRADVTVAQTDGVSTTHGFVEVTSGTVNLFGRQWIIDNADVRLAGDSDSEPRIDVRVRHDFPTVTVYVAVSGPPSSPRVRFSSDPGIYSQDQLLGFVLGGTPGSTEEDAPLADQAVGAATGFLLGQVQSRLQDKLPIDTISVELDDSASAEAVSVGKWISSRVFVAYNHRIAPETDENTNAGLVQFRLGRGWMLETTYGDRGNGSADLLYRKRF